VHLVCVMVIAWVTGFLCDKGLPRMITSGIVFIVAGALRYTYISWQSDSHVPHIWQTTTSVQCRAAAVPVQKAQGNGAAAVVCRKTSRRKWRTWHTASVGPGSVWSQCTLPYLAERANTYTCMHRLHSTYFVEVPVT
jgi:hypothetical protein